MNTSENISGKNLFQPRHRSDVFVANFEQISHVAVVFPLLTLKKKLLAGMLFLF